MFACLKNTLLIQVGCDEFIIILTLNDPEKSYLFL